MTLGGVGTPVLRQEDHRLLTGAGCYVDDVQRVGMVHLAVLRSSHSHARIERLEVSQARQLPGVEAVYTAADLPLDMPPIPARLGGHPRLVPFLQYPLARQVVRYVGEPLAVVVAQSRYIAEDALDRLVVQYRPCASVTDVEGAGADGAPVLFPDTGSNIALTLEQSIGDVEKAFREADLVVTERFTTNRHTGMPLETRGLVAEYDRGREQLTVWGTTKVPHINRTMLATMLPLSEHQIHCVASDVGGGFGVRGEFYPEDFLVPYAAWRLGRPVKWIEDRREHFLATNHSRQQVHEVAIAVRQDGTILGLQDTACCDMGAYIRTHGVIVPMNTVLSLPGPYRIPAYAYTMHAVLTNKTPTGTYRSPGYYEANFIRERLLDIVADRLRLDPVVLRQRNLLQATDMPYDVGTKALDRTTVYDSGNFPKTLAQTLVRLDYAAFRRQQRVLWAQGRYQGIGLAIYAEKSGLGPFEGAKVQIDPSGRVLVVSGATSMGQGIETILRQIAVSVLGVAPTEITVRLGDTAAIPYGVGTFASRTAVMAGNAVHEAAGQLREKICQLAAVHLEAAKEDIVLAAGRVYVQGAPDTSLSLRELARLASPGQRPGGMNAGLEATAYFQNSQPTYASGVAAVIIEVDIETGKVTLIRGVVGYDLGRAINPLLVEGQLAGGMARGMSGAMLEELIYDETGQLLTATFMDYLLPTAMELPALETVLLEDTPAANNPLGVKGVGEGGIAGMGGAVANAVADALRPLGVHVTRLPLHPAVLQAGFQHSS